MQDKFSPWPYVVDYFYREVVLPATFYKTSNRIYKDAVQVESADARDVCQSAQDSETMGEGNTKHESITGQSEEETKE